MEISVQFHYDAALEILFAEDNGDLRTREDVDIFISEYVSYFRKLGRSAYVVSNIDHLLVHDQIADYYGEQAGATIAQYILGFARWGTNSWSRMTLRTTSLKAGIPTNIYLTREEAVAAVEQMKSGSGDGR